MNDIETKIFITVFCIQLVCLLVLLTSHIVEKLKSK